MNILYYGLSSNQGGIETYLYKIARNIDRNIYNLYYMDETGGNACFRKELEEMGAVFFDITPRRKSIRNNRIDLKKMFSNNKIDVLHFNCNTLSYIEPVLLALENNVKVVLHSRNSGSVLLSAVLHKLNYYRLNMNSKNFSISRVAVSDLAGKWMFGKKGNYQVLNNGVEIEKFHFDRKKREKKRIELGFADKHVYGNVGAFLKAKNHNFIIDIFMEIAKKDEEAVLVLVGDGPLRVAIEKKIKELNLFDRVYLMGIRNDIPELMMAMDCLIFPSLYEGFPNVILEAETTGLSIVMSDLITSEVAVMDNCIQSSLTKTPVEWGKICSQIREKVIDREKGALVIEKAGFSVRDEIQKIERLYREVQC